MDVWSEIKKYCCSYKYMREMLIGGSLVILIAGSAGAYMWYSRSYNQDAQLALSRAIELYQQATVDNSESLLENADQAFSQAYSKYSSAELGPYFLVYRSEIALARNKYDDAYALLLQAINSMSKKSPLYGPSVLKLALLGIDSQDPALQQKGHDTIKAYAEKEQGDWRDMALYYQGLLNFDGGDLAKAKQSWDVLIKHYGVDSVWAQQAQAKLDYSA